MHVATMDARVASQWTLPMHAGVELVDVHVVTKAVVVRHDARSTPAAALLSALNAVEMKATLASAAGPRRLPAEGM